MKPAPLDSTPSAPGRLRRVERGAQASANLYSLIETAKANGIEPYAYLRHVFTEIPKATTLEDIEALVGDRAVEIA